MANRPTVIPRPAPRIPDPAGVVGGSGPREAASPGPGRHAARPGPAVAVRGLSRRFGERVAFDDLTFEVGRGEVFGMLGPNGAGKTTTVRVLCTLLPPTSGTAEVAGIPLSPGNERELRRRISLMTETAGLYLRLTVRDNLEFFAGLAGLPAGRTGERIRECLELVGVADRVDDRAGALSKGLRQRVALARALLPDPDVLFLDEPTAGLDPAAAAGFRRILEGLRERGTTVFLTTHRLDEAERCCDRIAIVNTRLASVGPVGDLFGRRSRSRLEIALSDPLP
ncbi:MAG TPA: ABC transporter ATP-binding protein, partial [Actinomycetota bacterium]|nr:ABC transporter ATP-binding protein [Actinomycetota bacterium]